MIFLYCVRNQILLASVSILKLASRSRSSDREEEQPIYIAAKNIFDNSPMFGNDAYNQSGGVSGVTYNCGGELLWPVLVFFFQKADPNSLAYTDCGTEVVLRPGDIVICRECGYRILYKKRTKQSKLHSCLLHPAT